MPTALYRRYRPDSFADVIGQEHVTAPLRQALRTGRVSHAYLFSGPRGCGKTTSARILARCLNCHGADGAATGPTDTPCGTCPSCTDLARGGAGSLDVVEIDAASHGGVDDARDLRERVTFVPIRDRYKVFVIDEAHMVSPAGFNALLKTVEEPPEHVMFVFATTEPDKVIGTIRSRTHHYPFHLVPPARLLTHLEDICGREGVTVGRGVLPLVVRAGAGSVRDALSVLDQLLAGADAGGLDYEQAISLLGYTHASLLDDVVDAFAAHDGASVFRVVDRVVESGHDPRRFVEDLLERLRDLIVARAVGDGVGAVLRGQSEDQLERIAGQARRFGAAELSRAADTVNTALTEMTGATSPRLLLELLCARVLLPGADGERGLAARVDRVERRLGVALPGAERPPGAADGAPGEAAEPRRHPASERPASERPTQERPAQERPAPQPSAPQPSAAQRAAPERAAPERRVPEQDADGASPQQGPSGAALAADSVADPGLDPRSGPTAEAAAGEEGDQTDAVRRMWPDVLDRLAGMKRVTWTLASQEAQVLRCSDGVLRLAFRSSGIATAFRGGSHSEYVRQALLDVLGLDVRVEPVVAEAGDAGGAVAAPVPAAAGVADAADDGWGTPPESAQRPDRGTGTESGSSDESGSSGGAGSSGTVAAADAGDGAGRDGPAASQPPADRPAGRTGAGARADADGPPGAPPAAEVPSVPTADAPGPGAAARAARTAASERGAGSRRPAPGTTTPPGVPPGDDVASRDDPDAEDSGMVGEQVVQRLLGGRVIDRGDS